jgi:MutS domain V/MutS domain III
MAMPKVEKRHSAEEIESIYRGRSERFARKVSSFGQAADWAQKGCLALLVLAIGCFLQAVSGGPEASRWFIVSVVLLGIGAVAVLLERRLRYRQKANVQLHLSSEHGLARMERAWEKVPVPRAKVPERHQAMAKDIDLFGRASLFHLLCRARTPMGVTTLRDWLLEPADPAVIRERQQAVAELSPELSLRQELEARTALLGRDPQSFLEWVEGPPWLAGSPWVKWCLFIQSLVPAIAVTALFVGLLPTGVGMGIACGACLVNLILTTFVGPRMHETFRKAASRDGIATEYLRIFELIARLPGNSAVIDRFRQVAKAQEDGAVRGLRGLVPIMVFGYAHRDPLKIAMYFPLQIFMLWDFYLLVLLERWQRCWVAHCRKWFETLGELEAIASLASLAQENPDWCLPEIDDQRPDGLDALQLGHPLLPDDVRVVNDLALGPAGNFSLISGSNMSGKSTLLRAIGLNVILAQAGGPVCAAQWSMSRAVLATVIRIDDSLVDGVSLFLNGLYRVKDVVRLAKQHSRTGGTLIYLLDEPLRGTNSGDRRIATQKVLRLLLQHEAVGIVSSHDVGLAGEGDLSQVCVAMHFQETVDKNQHPIRITFDYKLQHGTATTTNALELVELVGLE